jgi:hypothetical protein
MAAHPYVRWNFLIIKIFWLNEFNEEVAVPVALIDIMPLNCLIVMTL